MKIQILLVGNELLVRLVWRCDPGKRIGPFILGNSIDRGATSVVKEGIHCQTRERAISHIIELIS